MILDIFNCAKGIGDTLQVRVTPKASSNRLKVEHNPDGTMFIRVYVTVTAEDGKANKEVLKLLAKDLGIAKTSLSIIKGQRCRDKTIKIT